MKKLLLIFVFALFFPHAINAQTSTGCQDPSTGLIYQDGDVQVINSQYQKCATDISTGKSTWINQPGLSTGGTSGKGTTRSSLFGSLGGGSFCVNGECIDTPAGIPSGGLSAALSLITVVINVLWVLIFLSSFIFFIYGGVKWITSGGDKQGLTSAKNTITYAVLGLFLAAISFAIIRFISGFFNFDLGLGFPRNAMDLWRQGERF